MSRTEKKCYVVSAGFHGLLLIVILFGAALMPEPEDLSSFKPINVYSAGTVSDLLSKGGDADAGATAPAAPAANVVTQPTPPADAPTPVPAPARPPKPEPAPIKRETRPEPEPVKPKPEPRREPSRQKLDLVRAPEPPTHSKIKPEKPEEKYAETKPLKHKIDLKELQKVSRSDSEQSAQAEEAYRAARAKAQAREQREVASALRSLKSGLSSGTLVQTTPGVGGGGGEISVNYGNLIFSKYYNAWIAPAMLEDDTPVVTASVTISRSGQVVSYHILRSSGNRIMDRSVTSALENVTYIAPFPENSTDQERTVTIEFNLQAKKQSG